MNWRWRLSNGKETAMMYEFPNDIDRDFYEHHQEGIEDAVFHFTTPSEKVSSVLQRDDNGVAISVTRGSCFFAIERVTLARPTRGRRHFQPHRVGPLTTSSL